MFKKRATQLFPLLLLILAFALTPQPTSAASLTDILNSIDNCGQAIDTTINIQIDPNIGSASNLSIVLFDGANQPFAWTGSVNLLNIVNLLSSGINFQVLFEPTTIPITAKIYGTNSAVNTLNDALAGTVMASVSVNIVGFEACQDALADLEDVIIGFLDGRLNDYDAGAPIAIFPLEFEVDEFGIVIYDPEGVLLLVAPPELFGECPTENTLLIENEDSGISLWHLSSCEYQIMAPTGEPNKWYIFIFEEVSPNTYYISFEEFIGG